MSNTEYLPGFPLAGGNARFVNLDHVPADLGCPYGVRQDLLRKQAAGRVLSDISVAALLDGDLPSDWDDLANKSSAVILDQLAEADINPLDYSHASVEESRSKMFDHATLGGVGIITAVLEVLPHLSFRDALSDPDSAFHELGHEAKGFVASWLQLEKNADGDLTYALALKKPDLDSANVYAGLRFAPKWFRRLSRGIGLDPDRVANLRGEPIGAPKRQTHPNRPLPADRVLFGCPAGKLAIELYDSMNDLAAEAGLYGLTYHRLRRDHSYEIPGDVAEALAI